MHKRRTPEELTEWEAGQVLIKASDCLHECARELKNKYPKYAEKLGLMALQVGTMFNGHGSHNFGLSSESDAPILRR